VGAPLPLAGLRFSLVGPGRVGASLAGWTTAAGASRLAVAGRRAPATGEAGRVALAQLATAGQDLLLVAVADAALAAVAAELARRPQAAVVLHTAGSLGAEVLAPLRAGGSAVGSLHPLKAFPQPLPDPAEARGVFLAVDGDPPAQELARRLAAAWGAVAAEVPAAARPLYHLAASLAAGGAVTLLALAAELAERLGLPAAAARGYLELCRGAVAAASGATGEGAPVQAALTGPVVRGDRDTVERQLAALARAAPEKLPLVRRLARETLHQQSRLAPLDPAQRELLAALEREGDL
jgi:predicted short-subunit dehydrogenase-like oxidoreductase (DUF2520 family)